MSSTIVTLKDVVCELFDNVSFSVDCVSPLAMLGRKGVDKNVNGICGMCQKGSMDGMNTCK